MVKELMHDPLFLAGKSEVAMKDDLQVAQDLLDTLMAHRESCLSLLGGPVSVRDIKLSRPVSNFGNANTNKKLHRLDGSDYSARSRSL